MAVRDLTSFLPTAEDLLGTDLPRLAEILLLHLYSWKDQGKVWQPVGGLNRLYFVQVMEGKEQGLGTPRRTQPEYGAKQPQVTERILEAWHWLERQGMLIKNPTQPHPDFFVITTEGGVWLKDLEKEARWEKLGVDRVKADLVATGGIREVGGGPGVTDLAWEWVRRKEGQAMLPAGKRAGASGNASFIAKSRIEELRRLSSPDFDFQKLIRLCEELNSSYENGNYYATAMLTRGVLDHVPPLFGHASFAQVASNYGGGGRSFKETIQHLEGAARKVSDGHLHMAIRKSETLPTPQQVYCGSQLDLLLAEIVRIMK